jgi:hypothetical protein
MDTDAETPPITDERLRQARLGREIHNPDSYSSTLFAKYCHGCQAKVPRGRVCRPFEEHDEVVASATRQQQQAEMLAQMRFNAAARYRNGAARAAL